MKGSIASTEYVIAFSQDFFGLQDGARKRLDFKRLTRLHCDYIVTTSDYIGRPVDKSHFKNELIELQCEDIH